MIWTKGTHQSAKFQIFYCSREFAVNLYFDRLLLLKVYKISGKESTEKLCLMTLTCGLKNDMWNLANFHQSIQSLKIWTLMGSFYPK